MSSGVAVVSPPSQAPRTRAGGAGRWLWAAGLAVAGVLLFTVYLRLSNTYPEDSDQANLALQAWDMLHGNLLLHGWVLSDVSFYTTELPQYMLLNPHEMAVVLPCGAALAGRMLVPPAGREPAGRPARTYSVGPWTVMVWNRNLLPDIPGNPS